MAYLFIHIKINTAKSQKKSMFQRFIHLSWYKLNVSLYLCFFDSDNLIFNFLSESKNAIGYIWKVKVIWLVYLLYLILKQFIKP